MFAVCVGRAAAGQLSGPAGQLSGPAGSQEQSESAVPSGEDHQPDVLSFGCSEQSGAAPSGFCLQAQLPNSTC